MNHHNRHIRFALAALVAAGLIGAGGYGLYRLGMSRGMNAGDSGMKSGSHAGAPSSGMNMAPSTTPAASTSQTDSATTTTSTATTAANPTATADGKRVLYWHDPMVPGQRFDKPGKSPFMDMQLVPVYADDAADTAAPAATGGDRGVVISPRMQQNLGVRTAVVTRGALASAIDVVGNVAYNERDVALVQARSNGFVERLYVRAVLDPVRKGQPLADLYVPEWIAAQEEYLSIRRMSGAGADGLLDAARQRMRLVGMNDDQIAQVAASGKTRARFTLTAPVAGVVTELGAREGMTVQSGAPLFRINGLATVWVNAEVPENLAAQVRPGSAVEARTPALPGTVFKGRVGAILPEVTAATRTLKARIELANPSGRLVPGMFVNLSLRSGTGAETLFVPSEAVIQTGTRSVVMLARDDGRFAAAEVETGSEANGQTEIRKGLEAGQKVVVSGQFLIDSEASLKGTMARMSDMATPMQMPMPATGDHTAMHGDHK
jgi:Cu(I)/Ag(I) efflux system membrane fusion protein